MKKLILSGLLVFSSLFLISTHLVRAHMESITDADIGKTGEAGETSKTEVAPDKEHTESVATVLQDILQSQNASTVQQLNLSKVSDENWELLGDALMESYHPAEAHELMDKMMGGEGSQSLKQMHIRMGQAYLGYGNTNYGPGMMGGGMMGGGMMGDALRRPTSIMGYDDLASYGILSITTRVMVLAFFGAGTYFFLKKAQKK